MPTKYSHQKTEDGDFQILRNDEIVATYDPLNDETSMVYDDKRMVGPINREVSKIRQGDAPAQEVHTDDDTGKPEPKPEPKPELEDKDAVIADLRRQVKRLQLELAYKTDDTSNAAPIKSIPARYQGLEIVPEGSPAMGKPGDLTEEFVEWCRNGGVSKEHFIQRYEGRLKDLTYKG